jgi:hypothetical protein
MSPKAPAKMVPSLLKATLLAPRPILPLLVPPRNQHSALSQRLALKVVVHAPTSRMISTISSGGARRMSKETRQYVYIASKLFFNTSLFSLTVTFQNEAQS